MQISDEMINAAMQTILNSVNLAVYECMDASDVKQILEAGLSGMKPAGVICSGCGSSWDDDSLAEEKAKRPELISCCPERKMITVFAAPSVPHEASLPKISALKNGDHLAFVANDSPKCPHCGEDFDIHANEAWSLYDENEQHEVECPSCLNLFQVTSSARWSFSTDEQEDADD